MLKISDIENSIKEQNVKRTQEYLLYIVENKAEKFYDVLAKEMMEIDNWAIRNMLAIALSDVRHEGTVDNIHKLLKSNRTKGYRATLLYALQPLDYIKHIEFIFELLKDEVWEVRWEAFQLIEIAADNIPTDVKEQMIQDASDLIMTLESAVKRLQS